ncbi:class I SAM-dependent methyltransferase [Patescibacteria group bacterium]|nr:class I SAM-dependent methyltransferase [Patescibacteria group bacterium]MBU4016912.1 class I SAM-dependent methyltransferase [Patescibacteria group bacterium]MBU4098877.1 class I SAM-dependent methyltransferase [Patescibacteria group bacterium]
MKNILNEKPTYNIKGRLAESLRFVDIKDVYNKTILDIGCGYGWCELHFFKKGAKKIVGTEITENDLITIKKHIKNKKAKFIVGNAIKLPCKKSSFDTAVSWEVIEHIPKNTETIMFSEIHRVLKKGGKFYLSTPYRNLFNNIFDPAWWLIGHRHYSKEKLLKYGKDHGFSIEKMEVTGSWWSLFSSLNMYITKWIFRRKRFFENTFLEHDDEEYKSHKGFVTIFVKYRKK